jgi:hypothetical protein
MNNIHLKLFALTLLLLLGCMVLSRKGDAQKSDAI